MARVSVYLLLFCCFFAHHVQAQNVPSYSEQFVDLRDIGAYEPGHDSFIDVVLDDIQTNTEKYFPGNVRYQKINEKISRTNSVLTVVVRDRFQIVGADLVRIPLLAFYSEALPGEDTKPEYFFRWFSVDVNVRHGFVSQIYPEREVRLSDLEFFVSIGLLERKLVLQDTHYGIKIIYPIAVGGIDDGVLAAGATRLLTPELPHSTFKREGSERKRWYPNYFAGRPFLRIYRSNGRSTAIGVHYQIDRNKLNRGFISHGCMRIRDQDLYVLDALLFEGQQTEIPVDVRLHTNIPEDHPYPYANFYNTVKNFGTKDNPQYQRGHDGLVVIYAEQGEPPLDKINDGNQVLPPNTVDAF